MRGSPFGHPDLSFTELDLQVFGQVRCFGFVVIIASMPGSPFGHPDLSFTELDLQVFGQVLL